MKYIISLTLLLLSFNLQANKRASEIYLDLLKMKSLNKVLYIAAHPDDENTRLLAYFSLGEKAETAYLSLTRGDGGQNLIGDELGYKLGVLRTQELLAARSYDKAKQYFTRAVDFGYSKSSKESLKKWGKDEILSDVVLVIRKFKPDIIITRFPPDRRGGHGHHTASAELAIEAFDKAADPNFLPEQVAQYGTWQTSSIYWNTSYWWMKDIADSAKTYPDRYFTKDIGQYNELLGMSYNEIGTIARSQHKCQGFGAILERGPREEYFEHLAGKKIDHSFFEHNPQTWSDIIDASFEKKLNALIENFDFINPVYNVPALIEILSILENQEKSGLINEKIRICKDIIQSCLGLYLEITADDYSFVSGEELKLNLYAVNRSEDPLTLSDLKINGLKLSNLHAHLDPGQEFSQKITPKFDAEISTPYWLENEYTDMYVPSDKNLIGNPQNEPTLMAKISLGGYYYPVEFEIPVEFKWRDPSYGEKRRDVVCTPELTANFEQSNLILKEKEEGTVRVKIHNYLSSNSDKLKLKAPEGWKVSPEMVEVSFDEKHQEKWISYNVEASKKAVDGQISIVNQNGESLMSLEEIAYDHIPTQTVIMPAKINAAMLDVEIEEGKVAYIKGVEDAVPNAIQQLGFELDVFEVSDLANIEYKDYMTIVLGIRIYNVHPELFNYHEDLFEWVDKGGNLIMQYNTASRSIRDKEFGPTPFKLSRNRVTEEDATVTFIDPEHILLNEPNEITQEDFDGWVQERGLYFAGEWSEEYKPLFSWNDQGEDPVEGGLIVMNHGKGRFIYTGISFFRELPNGVVGAYRLFANLLSYDN